MRKGFPRTMKIEPSLSASRFSKADPGSLVQIEGKPAVVAVDSTPLARTAKVVAMYDVANSRFELAEVEDAALIVFHGEVTLRPDLSSAFDGCPGAASKNEIYLKDDRPHIVLHSTREFRLLDLSTGMIEPMQRSPLMTGFKRWEICVPGVGGKPFTLFKTVPSAADRAAAAASARGLMER